MEPGTYFLMREDTETKGPPTRETVVNVTQAEKKSDGALRLNPRSSTSSFLSRVIGACLAVLLWGVDAQAQDEVATLLNLSPWQSYVHLFCDKTGGADCAVTFRCGQQSGAPVTWPVEVEPSRIFTYWPNKTDGFGRPAGLEAALVNAGLTSPEARRRTTCTVRSDDPVEARAYTFIAGQLIPVANIVPRAGDDNKVATLLNLSPWQSYVHLFCDKTGGADCAVTFRCGQQSGAPVTWPVEVEPSRIFTYWPNKTDGFGRPAGLEAALVNAGLTSAEARRRTTCTVRSDDSVKARAYTFIAGQLVPVANVKTVTPGGATSDDHGNTLERATRVRFDTNIAGVLERAGDEDYFRVEIAEAGNLTVETTGTTDTYGYLRREDDTILGQNDDGGDASNFRIVQSVTTGTYYVVVIGYDGTETGPYTLSVRFSAGEPDGGGPQPTLRHVAEAEASHCLDVRRDFSSPGSYATIRNRCNFRIHARDACTLDGYRYSRSRGIYSFGGGLGIIGPLGRDVGTSAYTLRTTDRSCPADNYKVIACRYKNVASYSPNFSEPDGSRYVCIDNG